MSEQKDNKQYNVTHKYIDQFTNKVVSKQTYTYTDVIPPFILNTNINIDGNIYTKESIQIQIDGNNITYRIVIGYFTSIDKL